MPTRANDNIPTGVRKIHEGSRAVWASLTSEEQLEIRIYKEARRQAKRELSALKREDRRKVRIKIAAMTLAGDKPDEIAAVMGMPVKCLWNLRTYWSLPIASKKGHRRLFSWFSDAEVAALDDMAADLGVDRLGALQAVLRAVMAEGAFIARRTLGAKRRPLALIADAAE
jgi:hypothetical protein